MAAKLGTEEMVPLLQAAKEGVIDRDYLNALLEKLADINITDDSGRTALMLTLQHRHEKCCLALMEVGANVNLSSKDGKTALMIAALLPNPECLQALIRRGAVIDEVDQEGKTALMAAAESGCKNNIRILIESGAAIDSTDRNGRTALMLAAAKGYASCLQILMESGAAIEKVNTEGMNAVMIAARKKSADCLSILLSSGCDVNITDQAGRTALLHSVSRVGNGECLEVLLNAGSDVNIQNDQGDTALMLAARGWNDQSYVHRLLEAGANVNLANNSGCTALMFAVGCDINHNFDMDSEEDSSNSFQPCQDVENMETIEALIRAGANVNSKDSSGFTPLLIVTAIDFVWAHYLKVLIDAGADVNAKDNSGKSALMFLAMHGPPPYDDDDEDYFARISDATHVLIDGGADVNAQDNEGKTALMYAVCHPYLAETLVHILASHGVDLDMSDSDGCTALVHALKSVTQGNCEPVLNLYRKGPYPVIDPIHHPLLLSVLVPRDYFDAHEVNMYQKEFGIQLFLCNGITPHSSQVFDPAMWMPFLQWTSLSYNSRIGEEKYLFANNYITVTDLEIIRNRHLSNIIPANVQSFLWEAVCNPWPLVKLALIAVSTALGPSPGREERIRNTGLPPEIQISLMFQRPIVLLHHDWDKIPIVFKPDDYEKLPAPYPLLYNWPFGHKVIDCDCLQCEDKEDKFKMKRLFIP